ncbi:MAG: OsmC family protein [Nocardioides sp.]
MPSTQEKHVNGVDTATLFATIDAVRDQPELARFRFRTVHDWVSGTHSEGRFPGFYGACQERTHVHPTVVRADHPAVLVGNDNGPTPAELLLNALGACLTAGIANVAAARGIELRDVRCRVEGDIDLQGLLGLDDTVRNGFESVRVVFSVDGDAEAERLAALVDQSVARSAVFDVVTLGTSVAVEVEVDGR